MNFSLLNNTVVICGMRRSGKSELGRILVKTEKSKFNHVFAISATNNCNNFYNEFVDEKNIILIYSEEWVNQLFAKMEEMNLGKNKNSPDIVNTLLIIDDSASNEGFKSSNSLERLFTIGRHYHISVLLICQRIKSLSTTCRINTNFLICGLLNKQSVDLLIQEYSLGDIETKTFQEKYRIAVQNYGFLIICNSSSDENLNSYYASIRIPKDKIKVL